MQWIVNIGTNYLKQYYVRLSKSLRNSVFLFSVSSVRAACSIYIRKEVIKDWDKSLWFW